MNSPLDELVGDIRVARELPPPAEARAIRQRAGVSANRLARSVSVHRSTLSRWERGLSTPRPSVRAVYAAVLVALQAEVTR